MKVVIDSNIFVSALWGGKPYAVLARVANELDTLFVTDDIITEIEETLKKPEFKKPKYNITQDRIDTVLDTIRRLGQKTVVLPQHNATGASRDKDDDMYLECALAANADYIVSGDKHLRELKEYKNIKIVNAGEYLEIVGMM